MRPPSSMSIIQIEVTNVCSHRCSNCTRLVGHYRKDQNYFISIADFRRAVDSLVDFPEIVGLIGGEPVLHPEFPALIEYYKERIPRRRRGLWSSLHQRYWQHFDLISATFDRDRQFLNDHATPSIHQPILVASEDVVPDEEERRRLISECWVQNLWSASVTPKGAFFCEVAAALDRLYDGPGGWPVEPGWWKIGVEDPRFQEQVERWCHLCGAAVPLRRRLTSDGVDDVSPTHEEMLRKQGSPKARDGKTSVYVGGVLPSSEWQPNAEWYLASPSSRMSTEHAKAMEERAPQIEGLVVCVGYADYLALTIPHAMRWLDRCVVVTDKEDKETKRLCASVPGVVCVETDAFHLGGAPFAKSAGIAGARNFLSLGSWVLFWDADIWMEPSLMDGLRGALPSLGRSSLYAPAHKLHLETLEMGSNLHNGGMAAAGSFQLVHTEKLKTVPHPVRSPHAGGDDIAFSFACGWPIYFKGCCCIHIGVEHQQNWRGRKSEKCRWTKGEIEARIREVIP